MTNTNEVDVCVVGLGPTGQAVAHRALSAGLTVTAIDPRPDRLWGPTYSCWIDELPGWLPRRVIASRIDKPTVHANAEHRIDRPYAVLSKPLLRAAMPIDGATVIAGRAARVEGHLVETADGRTVRAAAVIDARGLPPTQNRPAASAHGIFVDADRAAGFVGAGEGLLLDWRDENGAGPDEPPSFLYAVPIGDGTVIFEETSLGLHGGMSQKELRRRTVNRLAAHGIALTGDEPSEAAHYPLDQAPPRRRHRNQPIPFGSRGGMMHPCTGYSVADSLALADTLIDALQTGDDAVRKLWTTNARLVYWMRMRGLNGLGRLTTPQSRAMFESFFTASPRGQAALLSQHDDAIGLAAVLVSTVAHTWPFHWRFDLVGWTNRHRWDQSARL
ncbi:lycopene cyclase [Skermania sp. ID1734]|uniref:lycopene cyclase family protein n=1 Tax=Skermania sp. ID1734 TaxID=2597516 RepID=UPI001180C4CD|nr:lycopene cyclase family protein [Skermania sp. ID1734]TSE02155.1 lycopene cyclase [Skermania sp. ID1734]